MKVSAAEFLQDVGKFQAIALAEPIIVVEDGRERTVLLSSEEYLRLKRQDRRVMGLEDFTQADLEAIKKASPPPEVAAFDHELNP